MLANLPLFETHVYTTNLPRAAAFYEQLLGLTPSLIEEQRTARFYYVGGHGRHMLGLWQVPPEKMDPRHFAFGVTPDTFRLAIPWLQAKGIAIHNHTRTGEHPEVHAWVPAVSLYFYDPDGNHLEILARLPDAPRPDLGAIPWDQWETLHGRTPNAPDSIPADLPLLAAATLYETHIQTADTARSEAFYAGLLGLTVGLADPRGARFYDLGGDSMLGVWPAAPTDVKRRHFAWGTTPEHFPVVLQWLQQQGIPLRNFDNSGAEPLVIAWMPAVSIYFADPDGHSLEVLAMLPDAPRPDLHAVPWDEWETMRR